MTLERFGFTPTESKAYRALLRLGPATGYAVARDLSIARANAYQALEALARRGAARRASSIPVRYTAMPPTSLMAELERGFRRDLDELGAELRRIPIVPPSAGGFDSIDTASALLNAAGAACARAATELLMVTGPWAAALGDPVRAAQARGVAVRAVSLGGPSFDGAMVRPVSTEALLAYWGGLPLAVVADRTYSVCGVLGDEGRASGLATTSGGLVPFVRHLLRRELAGGAA